MSKRDSTRVVGYSFKFDFDSNLEEELEKVLSTASCVTQFEVGRGDLWFNGRPGKCLRDVKSKVSLITGRNQERNPPDNK